jgi:hypothetical protein
MPAAVSMAATEHKYEAKNSWMRSYSSHQALILWTVSRPIELSLQSSLQLSLTVLVRYRSHCNIQFYAEFTTLLSCTTKQLDSFVAIPTIASPSHRISTFCDLWLLSGRHGKQHIAEFAMPHHSVHCFGNELKSISLAVTLDIAVAFFSSVYLYA